MWVLKIVFLSPHAQDIYFDFSFFKVTDVRDGCSLALETWLTNLVFLPVVWYGQQLL